MPAQWTGVIIGQMHTHSISAKELANELEWNPKYLSQVLNSRVNPKAAEEKIQAALERIIERKTRAAVQTEAAR